MPGRIQDHSVTSNSWRLAPVTKYRPRRRHPRFFGHFLPSLWPCSCSISEFGLHNGSLPKKLYKLRDYDFGVQFSFLTIKFSGKIVRIIYLLSVYACACKWDFDSTRKCGQDKGKIRSTGGEVVFGFLVERQLRAGGKDNTSTPATKICPQCVFDLPLNCATQSFVTGCRITQWTLPLVNQGFLYCWCSQECS